MWPPRAPAESAQGAAVTAAGGFGMELKRKRLVVLPFGYYLQHRPPLAALANQLLAGSGLEAAECADGNVTSLRSLELARQRLRSFDEVGVTECTRRYWRRLGARLGWSNLVDESIMDAAEAREHNDYYKPAGMEFTQTTTRGLRPWVDAQADSELDLRHISLHLPYISLASPLYLAYSRRTRSSRQRPQRRSSARCRATRRYTRTGFG